MPTIGLDDAGIRHLCERDWRLAHLIERLGPLSYEPPATAFSSLAHSIIEQMLSIKAAATIEQRIYHLCQGDFCPRTVAALSEGDLRACGVSVRKARSLRSLAAYAIEYDLEALRGLPEEEIRAQLTALPGVGTWTCDMFLLFYLDLPDILPVEDGAFRQAFRWLYGAPVTDEGVRAVVCGLWHPYASTAVRYLYRALNTGLIKEPVEALWANEA